MKAFRLQGECMDKEQNLTPEQKWEQATLANNFIFYKVMRQRLEVNQLLLIPALPTILIRHSSSKLRNAILNS